MRIKEWSEMVNKVDNRKESIIVDDGKNRISHSETTAIRISTDIYESLREKAFFERTTIRQVADDILEEYLED